jgi:L-threonylcarbamoyladenylate synthase
LKIKKRPEDMGLILLGSSLEGIEHWLDIKTKDKEFLLKKNNAPITFLIPKTNETPPWITGKHKTLALRISQQAPIPFLHGVLGSPIISTSANIHGGLALNSYEEINRSLSNEIDFVVKGSHKAMNRPSKIIDILTKKVIRD